MTKDRNICFVIMPFSQSSKEHAEEYWTKHYEKFLKPLIEESIIIEVKRSEALRGDILTQIITDLITSRIVVADLTDSNPNVYWELGVRQSFRHGTITICQEGTDIPFDITTKGVLSYTPKDHIKNAEFREKFKHALIDCMHNPEFPDSHVLESIHGRGTLFQLFNRDETKRRLKALAKEIKDNKLIFDIHMKMMKKNKKLVKGERKMICTHFRTTATELFITNRYLDISDKDYDAFEVYYHILSSINFELDNILIWGSEEMEKDIENKKPQLEKVMRFVNDIVEKNLSQIQE
jgi:hypothetical protein